jgi:hypothetical protein
MTDGDLALKALLDPLVPPREEPAEWDDVLRRAHRSRPRVGRRRLVLVAAALVLLGLALSPVGPAIADGIGSFSAWVSGEPGQPASPAEQQAFERANERTWAVFAPGTKLRRLLEAKVSGTAFTLYGFRSGDDLCLRLVASGAASGTSTHCAPLHALQTAKAPALVVATDEGIGTTGAAPTAEGFVPEAYSATFGIASDGVKSVSLRADDGMHGALLGANAFLYIADHPKLGTRVRGAEAVAGDGAQVPLELQSAPFGYFDLPNAPKGTLHGPREVDRHVTGGSIGWIERLEPRGEPLPPKVIAAWSRAGLPGLRHGHVLMARALQPDPGDYLRVGIIASSTSDTVGPDVLLCVFTIDRTGSGGGCSPYAHLFDIGRPFTVSQESSGSDQYSQLDGLASDDVAALKIFRASGSALDIRIRDNAYVARVARSDFPIRLVAYDSKERVIGIQSFASDGMSSPAPPEAKASVQEITRVTGDGGASAVLEAGKPFGGYRCWTIDFSGGSGGGGCTPWPTHEQPLLFVDGTRIGNDAFLTGPLSPDVASVTLTYANGELVTVKPVAGFIMYAIPSRFVDDGRVFVAVRALDADGKQIDERGIRVGG